MDKRFTAQNAYDQNNRLATLSSMPIITPTARSITAVVTNNYDAQGKLVGEHQEIDRDANSVADFRYASIHTYDAQGEADLVWVPLRLQRRMAESYKNARGRCHHRRSRSRRS